MGLHSFTCKLHDVCLSFVSVHRMTLSLPWGSQTSSCSLLLIYRFWRDERL